MDTATLALVGVSMCSELGPVLTSLMVAGHVRAAIAAKSGRCASEQSGCVALATIRWIISSLPRLVALFVMPILTAKPSRLVSVAVYAVAVCLLDVDPTYSWRNMLRCDHSGFLHRPDQTLIFGGIVYNHWLLQRA